MLRPPVIKKTIKKIAQTPPAPSYVSGKSKLKSSVGFAAAASGTTAPYASSSSFPNGGGIMASCPEGPSTSDLVRKKSRTFPSPDQCSVDTRRSLVYTDPTQH